MRLGLISDVHANLPALRVAIDRLSESGVDRWVCAGDIVGYGPHPNQCVAAVAGLDALCVAGNHDLMLLGRLAETGSGAPVRLTLDWTREVLHPEHRAYLEGLPHCDAGLGIRVAHGSPADPREYVRRPARAIELLDQLGLEHPEARVLVLGHTHRSWLVGARTGAVTGPHRVRRDLLALPQGQPVLVNPGAIGQSRNLEVRPRVRFALLDLEHDTVQFFAEAYDSTETRRDLTAAGLPLASLHRRPRPVRRAARSIARAVATPPARAP